MVTKQMKDLLVSALSTWFAVKQLQAAELNVEVVVCSGHDVFNLAGTH